MSTIGFVGLGALGAPIAGRLLEGNTVYGTARTRARAKPLIEQGMHWRATPREVAAAADIVFSMVAGDTALRAVTSGWNGILAGLRPGSVYVDLSAVSPEAGRKVARRVEALRATMIDAPIVSGGIPAARAGTLSMMAGGPEEGFRTALPLLSQIGTVTHVGGNGEGLLLLAGTRSKVG